MQLEWLDLLGAHWDFVLDFQFLTLFVCLSIVSGRSLNAWDKSRFKWANSQKPTQMYGTLVYSPTLHHGNTGYGVFKGGIQN